MPGHDLGGDARGVEGHLAVGDDVAEAVLADEHEQGGRRADERLGTQTRGLAAQLALEADERAEAEREQQLADLAPALAVVRRPTMPLDKITWTV